MSLFLSDFNFCLNLKVVFLISEQGVHSLLGINLGLDGTPGRSGGSSASALALAELDHQVFTGPLVAHESSPSAGAVKLDVVVLIDLVVLKHVQIQQLLVVVTVSVGEFLVVLRLGDHGHALDLLGAGGHAHR